jgi:hypothetical protein
MHRSPFVVGLTDKREKYSIDKEEVLILTT